MSTHTHPLLRSLPLVTAGLLWSGLGCGQATSDGDAGEAGEGATSAASADTETGGEESATAGEAGDGDGDTGSAGDGDGDPDTAGDGDRDGDGDGDGDINGPLVSGMFTVTQSWSQETDFDRPVFVRVPPGPGPFPVAVLLHGNGGNAMGMLNDIDYLPGHILLAPQGYLNSWNLNYEQSKAPDVALMEEVLAFVKTHSNVIDDDIAVLGNSNGSGLVNRLMIELAPGAFRHGVTIVSPLNDLQYREGAFYFDPTGGNAYDTPITPATGRRLCNVSGVDDGIIPYGGGPGVAGYVFVPAEDSIYVWAQHMGEAGPQLDASAGVPDAADSNLVRFEYLGGDVVHYKVIGAAHDAGGVDSARAAIAAFLDEAP